MKTNQVLETAEIFFEFLKGFTYLGGIILVTIIIYSFFSPTTFDGFYKKEANTISYNNTNINSQKSNHEEFKINQKNIHLLNKLTPFSRSFLLVESIFYLTISILILRQLNNFVKSVKDYHSFHSKNSKYFTNIGKYISYLFIFEIIAAFVPIVIKTEENKYHSIFSFDISPFIYYIAIFLLSYTISQVFKEGERLKIESELTI
ncbi:DUF2975 domain-containing protein [uncultured Lutibacter sp.]|uniref:DUF2975 domain-containing protein n=1 Tax=uncultured Lutibacter sp. TaxID=437739 RepID=UPI00263185D1|nr:DUF2975 domain-containing protein [uncultured Lutibacter sp.]